MSKKVYCFIGLISLFYNYVYAQVTTEFSLGNGVTIRTSNKQANLNIQATNFKVDSTVNIYGYGKYILYNTGFPQNITLGYKEFNAATKPYPIIAGRLELRNPFGTNLLSDLRVTDTMLIDTALFIISKNVVNFAGGTQVGNNYNGANQARVRSSFGGTLFINGSQPNNFTSTLRFDTSVLTQTGTFDSFVIQNGKLNALSAFGIQGTGAITIANGAQLTSNRSLTLLSTSLGTARINPGAYNGGYINGTIVVQRFFPPTRSFSLVTAPFSSGSDLIINSWQKGINIYGPGGIVNGFTGGNDTTIYYYNPLSVTNIPWTPVPNTNATRVGDYSGFLLQVLKPNDTSLIYAAGNVNQGVQSIPVSAGVFALVGNPYPNPINFLPIYQRNNLLLKSAYKLYDPSLGAPSANASGAFITYSFNPISQTYDIAPLSQLQPIIQSGQALIVEPTASGYMNILESDKTIGNSNLPFGGTATVIPNPTSPFVELRVGLSVFDATTPGKAYLVDGALAMFDPAFLTYNNINSIKLPNINENIGLSYGNQTLSIYRDGYTVLGDTLFLNVTGVSGLGSYQLNFNAQNFITVNAQPYLYDKLNPGVLTNIPANENVSYNVSITSDPVSYAPNRFAIVFLPITTNAFFDISSAYKGPPTSTINVTFEFHNETNVLYYKILKANIVNAFDSVGVLLPRINNNTAQQYVYKDANVIFGINAYRVVAVQNLNRTVNSPLTTVNLSEQDTQNIVIAPNPVVDNFNLSIKNLQQGVYTLSIYTQGGQEIITNSITYTGGNQVFPVKVPRKLSAGVYYLVLRNGNIVISKLVQKVNE
ncbi:MAG: T9SS type A sorting domain-containing protein [Phycisphaerales bacterium]|nr:T9SS type A sorting domain-containing protein [Phycisphaerales bacterium]